MKTNIKSLELIEKGMTAKTVSKLTESQVNILHSKLLGEQVQEMPTKKSYQVGPDGGNLPAAPKGYNVKKTATGDVIATPNESELGEEEEVTLDPNINFIRKNKLVKIVSLIIRSQTVYVD